MKSVRYGMKKELLSVRIAADLKARLDRASDQERDPYAPTRARIIERGIELAVRELEAKKVKTTR
jgi:hypothetical protein